ncbi:MAG: glycosyltransferase 87 family protein [Chloroflexota bacterium]
MATSGGIAAFDTPNVRRVLVLAAVVGLALGIETVILHLTTDPLADMHAYYDAGARLNAGLPLYEQTATTNEAEFYRYPPLLAIVFRPLARLPFEAAAVIWMTFLVACLALTIVRLGARRRETWLVMGMLALPTGWSLAIGQAQVVVTLLTVLAAPWAIALAANLKVFPALIAIWWVGRRDVRSLAWFAASVAGLVAVQFVLEPQATIDFVGQFGLAQVGHVENRSLYALSPILWAAAVIAGIVLAWRLAPTRWGWPAAVALSVLATPRLLIYMLSTLVAVIREPDPPEERE